MGAGDGAGACPHTGFGDDLPAGRQPFLPATVRPWSVSEKSFCHF